jgi:hypothetical protein
MLDKILHLLAGFVIATVFQFSWIAMVGAVLFFAIGKEVYDVYNNSLFDMRDLICTFAGGFTGYVFTLIY